MNILAIDYGTKNIGLAWVDTALGVVLPFGRVKEQKTRSNHSTSAQVKKEQLVIDLIKKEKVDKIIIGLPIGLDGNENRNTKLVREFTNELKKQISVPMEFVDERFSSQAADRMGEGGASRDERAAMVMLEDYLASLKSQP